MVVLIPVLLALVCGSAPAQESPPAIDEVILVSGLTVLPDDSSKIVAFDAPVRVWAVLRVGEAYYLGDDAPAPAQVRLGTTSLSLRSNSLKRWPSEKWPQPEFSWFLVMPRMQPTVASDTYPWYSNVITEGEAEGQWRGFDIIEYEQIPLPETEWSTPCPEEPGTYRFRVEIQLGGQRLSTRGRPDSSHPSGLVAADYDRGIVPAVHRISRLSNHPSTLIRYLEGMRHVPWCWGPDFRDPPENTPSLHQSDYANPVCTECSEVVIASVRAMGYDEVHYTSVKNMVEDLYTSPLDERVLTFIRVDIFRDWVPRTVTFRDSYYCGGGHTVEVRNEEFRLQRRLALPHLEVLDLDVSPHGDLVVWGEKEGERAVYRLSSQGEWQSCFEPTEPHSITLGDTVYWADVPLAPTGLTVGPDMFTGQDRELVYLLKDMTIHGYTTSGERVDTLELEPSAIPADPVGQIRLRNEVFYLPLDSGTVLVYDRQGRLTERIELPEPLLGFAPTSEEDVLALHPFPVRAVRYDARGTFLRDFGERIIDEAGNEVRVPVGPGPNQLTLGDPIFKIAPSYHTQLYYQDNGNGVLDGRDTIICVGHEGVELRLVDSLEGKKFVLKKFDLPSSTP